jgi:hypothetical protein
MIGAANLFDDCVGVFEDLVDGHGVHLAAVVVAGLDGVLEIAAGGLGGEVVGNDVAGPTLLFDPGEVGHGDPDGATVDGEADIGGVGVARGDSDDSSLPLTVEVFAGPAVGHLEVFIHDWFQPNGVPEDEQGGVTTGFLLYSPMVHRDNRLEAYTTLGTEV